MANFSRFSRKRLGEILVNEGLISTQQIQEALDAQGNTGEMLGETLVRLGYITEEKIAITRRFAAEILPLFDSGTLRPVIDSRFDLADIVDAHRYMESNANVGKLLIDLTGAG